MEVRNVIGVLTEGRLSLVILSETGSFNQGKSTNLCVIHAYFTVQMEFFIAIGNREQLVGTWELNSFNIKIAISSE